MAVGSCGFHRTLNLLIFELWLAVGDGLVFKELIRVRFFKKIEDWILKSERIRIWILRFFTTRYINP